MWLTHRLGNTATADITTITHLILVVVVFFKKSVNKIGYIIVHRFYRLILIFLDVGLHVKVPLDPCKVGPLLSTHRTK